MAGPDPSRITDRLLQQNRPTGDIPRSLGSTAPASSAIAQYFAPITEKDAQLLQVLIGQIRQDREINAVFGKGLRVLGKADHDERGPVFGAERALQDLLLQQNRPGADSCTANCSRQTAPPVDAGLVQANPRRVKRCLGMGRRSRCKMLLIFAACGLLVTVRDTG